MVPAQRPVASQFHTWDGSRQVGFAYISLVHSDDSPPCNILSHDLASRGD